MENSSSELVSALTHLVGALLALVGFIILVASAVFNGTTLHVISFSIFGTTLVLLYTASAIYHFIPSYQKSKSLFRRIDHSMIFFLIAGTYTPIALVSLRGVWGWTMLGVVWALALVGVSLKTRRRHFGGWRLVALYLFMGWSAVFAISPLLKAIPINGLIWLLAGGVFYTAGTIFFGISDKKLHFPWFRGHDIFHVFVMLGSFSHFWLMFKYVL